MQKQIIDSHIHLDLYKPDEQKLILESLKENQITDLITVSKHLKSSKENLALSRSHKNIHPAFGYHPEQTLPTKEEMEQLTNFILKNQTEMIAVGEVGLPYYLRKEQQDLKVEEYIEVLEHFILLAKQLNKPIILHAVYEDAPLVCSLLEKHGIKKAHFHWFKGDRKTLDRLKDNDYYLSVTPDAVYKKKIQSIISYYPLSRLMVETDGPWAFENVFKNQMTHPKMIHQSVEVIASRKGIDDREVYEQLYQNTKDFYF